MTVETKLPFDKEYVSQLSSQLQEPDWLQEIRIQALEKVVDLPLPVADKTKIDKWNFTEFAHELGEESLDNLDSLPESIKELIDLDSKSQNLLLQRNGVNVYTSLTEDLTEKGVIFTDIHTAAREHSDLLRKYYMTDAVKVDEHRLTALHAALMNAGTFIYVPKNVELTQPIQAIYWKEKETALFNHVIVVAEDNSSVTYIENYLSFDDKESVANVISEVIAGANAKVNYGAVDHFANGMTTYVNRRGIVGRDARVEWALGQMNEGYTVSDNTTNLLGDGSFADTKTVTVGRGEQKQNFTTRITHFGKNSEGYILNHGVVKDAATSIFNGIGKIEHGASKSNAEQSSRVLMLSEKARGDANPILLIDEDDVTAGHAASVGRVDPMQLYYLMSRGIPQKEAERLVIHGFLAPVVNELPIEGVKKQLVDVIERKVR
ncbi:Fe-S cluster assembly protein SufD [Bacillus solimangrovi]|uniref:Fe-S cluster assembly protein SufD n=1 Tax=Bacillus solimangrovi TaxID=1305675 RepID=A0A1E5LDX6_9BACI|nr:Fe-S cluster assembly protein SufD [Bacillus solimangrovi]OEH92287.1 Fe-S cluster assembly protein SufD [Bacillus solimangrovi]